MHFNVLNRKVHYWISFALALPILVIIGSGLFLQMKKHSAWVQPPERRGVGTIPTVSFDDLLNGVRGVPELGVRGWEDVNRLDVRPDRGLVKVWLRTGYEVQLDLETAAVLQVAYRRSDIIESIHDGSIFAGDWTKLGLFLPAGVTLLILWISGIWMFLVTFTGKRRLAARRRRAHTREHGDRVTPADPARSPSFE